MGHIRIDLPNTNNKWVGFGLANVDMFIIRVRFGLANVDTIRTLTRHEHEHDPSTRIATPSYRCPIWVIQKPNINFSNRATFSLKDANPNSPSF